MIEPVDGDLVATYTGGRLAADDLTDLLVAQALAACRRYCGWHVCPVVEDDEIVVDGPGGYLLDLPTARLLDITELTEDDVALDVDVDIVWSAKGLVRKATGATWTDIYGAIVATIDHGYTPDEAADFTVAVLQTVDRLSLQPTGGPLRQVGEIGYFGPAGPSGAATDLAGATKELLSPFRLEPL